ncbi:hypothetical protein JCGZ_10771 [Jatropha curcas]|uniref:Uncharacterized protein n=1 Tax=Jatropha curcas TaxID=180498 RepID=A0A067LR12_JATCU|nr:hypothetical protein JCGZ_10771 [Jatropha curcas]
MGYTRRLRVFLGHSQFGFDLETTICNHGFFMMAPNKWISETKTLQRPLRLANGIDSLVVSISHTPENPHVDVHVHDVEILTEDDEEAIQKQVYRMLRVDEFSKLFHEKHEEAKEKRFCKLFRSASLFEDAVKSILLCNTM